MEATLSDTDIDILKIIANGIKKKNKPEVWTEYKIFFK